MIRARWLALLCLAAVARAEVAPVEPLRVADNGRFFVGSDGRPVFLLADTAWALILRLRREEVAPYLEHRRAQGFNAVALVLYRGGNRSFGADTANAYGREPFVDHDAARPLVTPGDDPRDDDAYDYWDHADFCLAEIRRLGLRAFVLPCWGDTVTGQSPASDNAPRATLDEASARTYGRWLGARYGAEPHLLWVLGGDRAAVHASSGRDFRPVFHALAEGLRDGGIRAPITYHSQKTTPQSGDWFHEAPWLGFNSNQRWPEDQIDTILRDWSAHPPKPTWLIEGRYEAYWKNNYKPEQWGRWQVRQQAWQTVFAGAFGHAYGHEHVFGFGADGVDWRPHLDAPGAGDMAHLAALMNGLTRAQALDRAPAPSLLVGPAGAATRLTSDRVTVSATPAGDFVMAYAANGRTFTLAMDRLVKGLLDAFWFNPSDGRWFADGAGTDVRTPFARALRGGPGAAPREFDPPGAADINNDWVLLLAASPET